MARTGILSGTILLQRTPFFKDLTRKTFSTAFGEATLFLSRDVAFIPRHGMDPKKHILPHRINHQANFLALREAGADEVIAVHSTGSLKRHIAPGMLVVPDDFIDLSGGPTVFETKAVHITPAIDGGMRKKLLRAAAACGVEAVGGGVYWQTKGPRLETRAEIALMAQFADLVGMTMASEAVIARELDLPFGSLCSVDNYAHGIGERELTIEEILKNAKKNEDRVVKILEAYMEGGRA
jgi:5'-methylthioadenosine phosphorylase